MLEKESKRHVLQDGRSRYLEVVRQFLSAGVPWVHRDEDGAGRVQHQLRSVELEPRDALVDGDLDALDLLRDHRQDFQLNAVELIEARPRARLRETLEELSHRLVVQAVGAVEYHTLHRNSSDSGSLRLHIAPPPQPFYGLFSGTIRVSRCQKRTSGLYGAREH